MEATRMDEANDPPTIARLTDHIESGAHEAAVGGLKAYESAAADRRREALQALSSLADDHPAAFTPVLAELVPFLTDDERAVRLTTAKLFVAVADAEPAAVGAVAEPLAERLADDEEFYYVRARAAEALGYVARDEPDAVDTPELLAELRVGLDFDEPEVVEKLAKALECVALGQPHRLGHHAPAVASHLDDDSELVRYHLCTALVAVGCERPAALQDCRDALVECLEDENSYVRGRAAEAIGLLVRADKPGGSLPNERLVALQDEEPSFVADRAQFAVAELVDETSDARKCNEVGSLEGVRAETEAIVEDITTPDEEGTCSQCGHVLPEHGPPLCPRCGGPQ
nr:HEAT repeat domain-containing protein [Halobacterium hubeiense]